MCYRYSDLYWRLEATFKKVQETGKRKAMEIAGQVLQSIREEECRKGNKLPSENRITSLTGVGRPVIGEALCVLQIVGVIETKVGNGFNSWIKEIGE